ncbi:MAG: molybdopterin-dependent oxidoreductase [Nocardioidaceae bacterium]
MTTIRWTSRLLAAAAGVLAAAAGVAAGSGLAALLTGTVSPIVSVGNAAIDLTPGALKDWAVETFGENDKLVLIGGVFAMVGLIAAAAGVIGLRRRRLALGITVALGVVAVVAAAADRTLTADRWVGLLPSVATLLVSTVAFAWLLSGFASTAGRRADVPGDGRPGDDLPSGFDRRRFLVAVLGTGAVAAAGGFLARAYGGLQAAKSRLSLRIPAPDEAAPPLPAGAQVDVDGVSSFITPNADFYRVDTALQVPDVPAETWQLRIHGMVDEELNLTFGDLVERRLIERRITLTCVSNQVGGDLLGNATWIGVPVKDLLEEAGAQSGADAVMSTSADDMTIGTPLAALTDDREAILAIAMNGEPLPLEHGFPVRMVVPGLYGFVSATKWLVDLEVSRFEDFTAYWTERDWSARAPIKTSSRVDVPGSFQTLPADNVRIGGVAWAQTKGIAKVEVRIDDGDWVEVDLAEEDSVDTWRQWAWTWEDATPGTHEVTVRATDASGYTQTSERVEPRPNGSTGWHSVQFTVE